MSGSASHLLVTGGAGFIGGQIVDRALARGWRVTILDSLRPDVHGVGVHGVGAHGSGGSRATGPDRSQARVIRGDVADARLLDSVLPGVDAVCHQAAKVGLGVDLSDSPDYVSSNSLATAVLLAAMARHGIGRLALASSMVVYGEGAFADEHGPIAAPLRSTADLDAGRFDPISPRTGRPLTPRLITEDAVPDPRNVYAATKLNQEHLVAAWARSTGGRAVLLRYHNVYGPFMPQNTPYAGVASVFRSRLEAGRAPEVFEDGQQRRDFVHVADVARANLAGLDWLAEAEPGTVRAFNIASGQVRTIGQMAAALAAATGGPAPIVTGDYRLGDVRHITASAQRARRELGWVPEVDFAAGMEEFATAPMRRAVESVPGRR